MRKVIKSPKRATREDVITRIQNTKKRGLTIGELNAVYPPDQVHAIRRLCDLLLKAKRIHRPGDKRGKWWVMCSGPHPEGKIVKRPSRRVVSQSTERLLRKIERAINCRDLVGPTAGKIVKAIEEHLDQNGGSHGEAK